MRKLFFFLAFSTYFSACGRDGDGKLDSVAEQEPLLRFAEVDTTLQEPQSYLVAFRRLLDDSRGHFSDLPTRMRSHMQALLRGFSLDLGPKQPRYLSSLNLSDLGHSFVPKAASFGPDFLQRDFQNADADTMASLVEVEFATDLEARRTLRKWLNEGRIYYAEPNGKSQLQGELEDAIVENFRDNKQGTPWLEQIAFLPAIQQVGALSSSIAAPVIAVMDSGVDVLHPNLAKAVYLNEQGQNKLCKDDLYGCNTTVGKKENLGDGSVYPAGTTGFNQACVNQGNCEHGTHVAGIIAAREASSYVGLCPYCSILVVKVVDLEKGKDGEPSFLIKDASIIAGLAYISGFKTAGEPLVRVINASFGKFEQSRSVELFIKSLKNFGRGTLMIAAAGNEDTMKQQFPAGFEAVMAVSNVVSDSERPTKSDSSNFGTWVDISAPGDGLCDGSLSGGIRSSTPGGLESCKVGTSMASPVVAGIAGLLLAKEPNLTAAQVERRLLDSAQPDRLYSDTVNNGYRPTVEGMGIVPMLGSGIVNANLALDPNLDRSPSVATNRNDFVRAGCGAVGGETGFSGSLILMLLPLLAFGWRRIRNNDHQ